MIVSKASNTSEATSSKTMGLLETGGSTNAQVNVVTEGLLSGLNTSTAVIGEPVWLGTNGDLIYGLTNKPYAPAHLVFIGVVTRVNSSNGEIFVKPQNGFELKEIHDIDLITNTPTNNQLLSYNSTTGLWANKSVTTADIAASTNKNYVTDAQATVIGNTSGTNTGDNAVNSLYSGLAASKQDTLVSGTNIKTIEGQSILGTGNIDITKTDVGLANVDNTSDANKPVSTAQATAIGLKQNTLTLTTTGTSGAATLVGATLNIPQYTGGGAASDYLSVLTAAEIAITTTATATINRQHLISGTSADYIVTLPAASGNTGKFVGIRISTSATRLFTIKGNASELIDGLNTRIMWKGESAILYCDGVGWQKIAGVSIPMKCIIYLNATQSTLFPTTTAVKVPLNTSYVNNTGFMANLANNRIDFKRRGEYILYGTVEFNALTVNSPRCLTQINFSGNVVANAECSGLAGGIQHHLLQHL